VRRSNPGAWAGRVCSRNKTTNNLRAKGVKTVGNKLIEIHDTNNWALNMSDPRNNYEEYTINFYRNNETGDVTIHSEYTGEQATLPGKMKPVKTETVFLKNVCHFTTKYLSMRHNTRWLNQDEALTFLQNQEALIFIPPTLAKNFGHPTKNTGWTPTPKPVKTIKNFTWGN
jgi:hypothetical protein